MCTVLYLLPYLSLLSTSVFVLITLYCTFVHSQARTKMFGKRGGPDLELSLPPANHIPHLANSHIYLTSCVKVV